MTDLCLFYVLQQILVLAVAMIAAVAIGPSNHRISTATPNSVSDVSGFYGPGAYASWVLTALSAILHSVNFADAPGAAPPDFDSVADGELLVTAGYSLIAAVDAVKRFYWNTPGASLAAASRVAFCGWALSLLAICLTTRRITRRIPKRTLI